MPWYKLKTKTLLSLWDLKRLTIYPVVKFVLSEYQGVVGDGTRVELTRPHDFTLSRIVLFMVTFDEDIPTERDSWGN